jgi:hypothetical protein
MGTIQIDGSTPKLTIGNATAEDATILFDGNAQDFYIALDDSADDLLIGLGSTVGTTPIISIDENKQSTFSGALTVGVDDTGHDVKLFGATASRYWLWDESADGVVQRGTLTVGVDDTGHDVKLFGASAGSYMEWDESADQLRIMGASADATTSTGKLLLATSLTDINANDVIGKIDFQAPHEAGGTDAITVAASIQAIAQGTFSSSVNATDLIFYTGHSEAAAEKIRFTSQNEIGIAGANYGTDGQVMTSGGAGAAVAWEDAASGGLSETETWRVSAGANVSSGTADFASNWEIDDTYGNVNIGSGMSESSGIFTFPSTGIWSVDFTAGFINDNGGNQAKYLGVIIYVTLDNSSYSKAAENFNSNAPEASSIYSFSRTAKLVDVTDTTNVKVKFAYNIQQDFAYLGSSAANNTFANFLRLGDT